jgi:hypothetical protein
MASKNAKINPKPKIFPSSDLLFRSFKVKKKHNLSSPPHYIKSFDRK